MRMTIQCNLGRYFVTSCMQFSELRPLIAWLILKIVKGTLFNNAIVNVMLKGYPDNAIWVDILLLVGSRMQFSPRISHVAQLVSFNCDR